MPTRIFLKSGNSIVVSEEMSHVEARLKDADPNWDLISFTDYEGRTGSRFLTVVANQVEYFKAERVSI